MQGNLEKLSEFSFCSFLQMITERYFDTFKIPKLYQRIQYLPFFSFLSCECEDCNLIKECDTENESVLQQTGELLDAAPEFTISLSTPPC